MAGQTAPVRLHFTSLEAGWSGATAGGKRPVSIREDAETLFRDAKQPGSAQDQGSRLRPVKLVTAPGVRGRAIVRRASNRAHLSRKRHARAGVVPGDAARRFQGSSRVARPHAGMVQAATTVVAQAVAGVSANGAR